MTEIRDQREAWRPIVSVAERLREGGPSWEVVSMNVRTAVSHHGRALVVLFALMLVAVSCAPGQDPRVRKAEQVITDVMAQDPQFANYAIGVAARSSSSFSEQLVLDHLSSADPKMAHLAVQAAARRPAAAFENELRSIFTSKSGLLQIEAANALAALGDEEALQWLREKTTDAAGDPNVMVLRSLAGAGEEELIRPLLDKGLEAEEQARRDEIYTLLGEIGEPWAVDLIAKGLEKEFGEGRRAAIMALGRSGDASRASLINRFVNTQGLVFASVEALGDLGNENSIPALEQALGQPEKVLKVYAAVALWKLGQGQKVQPTLDGLFTDPDPGVRAKLAEQLGKVPSDDVLPMLAGLAEDGEARVRIAAVRALRERSKRGLQPILVERVTDSEYEAAVLALDALGTIGDASVIEAIEPLLENENGYVAISAANAILEILAREGANQASS